MHYFTGGQEKLIWRISVAPSEGAKVASRILEKQLGEVFYDWGGGLIWLALNAIDGAGSEVVRDCVRAVGGHATLIRAPDKMRASVSVFEPQTGPLKEIAKRIKNGFDPYGILNPGRMQRDF